MTYQTERTAIEGYFGRAWGHTTPIGLDGQAFEPSADSVRLTITPGAVRQGSIGRVRNRIDHLGLATVSIFTEGGKGSAHWRHFAQLVQDIFFEKTITTDGEPITTHAGAFIRFSPPELGDNRHPYIAAEFQAKPYHQANIIAPFIRYETR